MVQERPGGAAITPGKDCIATEAVEASGIRSAGQTLSTMRAFRDKVLMKSAHGRRLIEEHDAYTPRVLLLFILEPSLRREAANFLKAILPVARAMTGGSSQAKVTAKTIELTTGFANALTVADRKHKGGPLAKAIRVRMQEIKPKNLVGLSASELKQVLHLEPDGTR